MSSQFFPTGQRGLGACADPGLSAAAIKLAAAARAQALKLREDKVCESLDAMTEADRAIAYKLLFARGMRIATVERDIARALRAENDVIF